MKVTVFSTKGAKRSVIETSATTWGVLKDQLMANNIPVDGMRAIVGETKVTLESSAAVLPVDFDFTLFLSPTKVKSGRELTRSECYEFIKNARVKDVNAKNYFGNYPTFGTVFLNQLIRDYHSESSPMASITTVVKEREVPSNIINVIENIKAELDVLKNYIESTFGEKSVSVEELQRKFAEIESTL